MKRYVLHAEKALVEEHFGVHSASDSLYQENYNVIPGNTMPVIIISEGKRQILSSKWGLSQEGGSDNEIHSFEYEKVFEKESLKKLVQQNPCIIPASGFYKWKETVEDPLPFYIRFLSKEVLGLAGIYSTWEDSEKRTIHTFCVLTMPANALVEPLDTTMPCILEESQYDAWLNGNGISILEKGLSGDGLLPEMAVYRVPELVNDPSNNSKELIQPIPKLRNYDMDDDDV